MSALASLSAPPLVGGFAELDVHRILDAACRRADLDPTGATLLRGHTNAVFRLRTAPVVVKIARRGACPTQAGRTVQLVEWLAGLDFPTVPLHPVRQPVVIDGQPTTFWRHLPQPAHPVRAEQLAAPLRTLHRLPHPPFRIPELDTVAAIRRSLDVITVLPAGDVEFLARRLTHLEKQLTDLEFVLPPGLLQGDPQHRNALHDGGRAVLCDWDTICYGPPELDLVTIEIHCRRFGYGRAHHEAFARAYGFNVTRWDGYPVLRDLRELRMITTNAKRAVTGSFTQEEVSRRVDGLRRGDYGLRWQIL
ncbi:aminoglycoside phosphotransferase family protein [Kitasatospora sp. RB6PN24]|uniref:phosphotransferase family protein n=1 Tax=Kitasatospora humi TaxID=2893891 RepID=UPI001E3AA1B2|nr:aminoglycoside phosphotransferase family protein [Kitasatospora humi]MCC9310296.1 aminoglycoside phosphotransferase family protein [Kitasatospora humi]